MGLPTSDERAAMAAELLRRAAAAAKCRPCGCARGGLDALVSLAGADGRLASAVDDLSATLVDQRYGCLGCPTCWPAEALALLYADLPAEQPQVCPTEFVPLRAGWPQLPGTYTVLRWQAPVAVCALGDAELCADVARLAGAGISIVGTLATENHGLERLVRNVVANPNLRFLVLAGPETRDVVGHLPGASLLALMRGGVDVDGRIVGAPGRRPVLRNVSADEVASFRSTVEVVDLIGDVDPASIIGVADQLARRDPGPATRSATAPALRRVPGYITARRTPDPAGYFVISCDRAGRLLTLEHYENTGTLDRMIEGANAAECYTPAIDDGLLTRLDHAAYLGRELARAEAALASGEPFVQDAAPEAIVADHGCGCGEAGCAT